MVPEVTAPSGFRQAGIEEQISLDNVTIGRGRNAWERALAFPDISYEEFTRVPYSAQKQIIERNRICNTDTYNRTMDQLAQKFLERTEPSSGTVPASIGHDRGTYSLQLRRSPFSYLVACGVEEAIQELTMLPISKAELSFAREYYKHTTVPFFNEPMWRWVVEENNGRLPFEIHGVRDGTVLLPGEPLLTVSGPSELVAHFEHAFHRVFYATLVATRAHALLNIIEDPSRFIEVGKRGAVTEAQHQLAMRAMRVGGGFSFTSNDAGVAILPLHDTGTIGHRYVQRFSTEEASFRHAIEHLQGVTLLVDLVDTYKGIDLSLKLKDEYRHSGKRIWVRLDSGDILDQVRYFLQETEKRGFTDPLLDRVVVEGIDSFDEIAAMEKMIEDEFGAAAKKRVLYGAGGLLISEQTARADASSGFKIAEYTNESGELEPTMKFSNSPGKISYPGATRLVLANGERLIAQMDERIAGDTRNYFEPLFVGKEGFADVSNPDEAHARAMNDYYDLLKMQRERHCSFDSLRATPSAGTFKKIGALKAKYQMAT